MVDTECGAQGTPRHEGKGHSFNMTLPCLPIPVIMWNNRPGASPTLELRTPAKATMRTTPVPRTTTGGPQLRIRVAVTVSLERPHLAVQHLIQPDGNLQGPGRAAGPHLPRPDGPLLPGLGQADGRPLLPHINDPANQTVQRPGQADGRLLPLPINPAKQTANLHLQLYIYRYLRSWSSPLATLLIALGSLASVGGEIKTFPFRHFTTQHTAATPAPSYKPGDLSTVNTPSIVS